MALYNANSASNYRQYGDQPAYDVSTAFTVAIWVKPLAASPALGSFVSRGVGSNQGDWNLSNVASAQKFRAAWFGNAGLLTAADTSSYTTGNWYHVAMVLDGTNMLLYVNGSNVATTSLAGAGAPGTAEAIRLFMRNTGGNTFDAHLGEWGFWNIGLSASEITSLSKGVEPLLIAPSARIIIDRLISPNNKDFQAFGADTGTLTYQAHPLIYHRPTAIIGKAITATAVVVADTRSALIPFNLRGPGKPMPILAPSGMPLTWTSAAATDVTVAITGVSATGAVGTVIPSTTVPATGVAGTAAVGTVAPSTTVPITGNAATSAVGSVTPSTTVALTGVAGTSAAGTVAPSTTVTVTGAAATAAVGSVTPSTTVALTGVQSTGAVGSVVGFADTFDTRTAAVPFNLRGPGKPQPIAGPRREPLTWTETNTSSNVTVGITGVAATGAVGSMTVATTVPSTGVAGTGAAGTVVPSTTVALTGVTGTAAVGSVTPSTTLAVSGVAGTAAVGTLAPSTTVGLTGVAGTTAVGTVTVSTSGDVTVAITGVSATGLVGTVTVSGGDTGAISGLASGVLAQFATNVETLGLTPAGHRFTLEREPDGELDGRYFLDVESLSPFRRDWGVGEHWWEAVVVVRHAYYRGGGDAGGGDRQTVMRNASDDAMRIGDTCEKPENYAASTTGITEIRYQGTTRAHHGPRGEIWETRLWCRWRAAAFTS